MSALRRVGGSLALVLPADIRAELGWKQGDMVVFRVMNDCVLMRRFDWESLHRQLDEIMTTEFKP